MTDLEWAKVVIIALMVAFVIGVSVAYAVGREHGKAVRPKAGRFVSWQLRDIANTIVGNDTEEGRFLLLLADREESA